MINTAFQDDLGCLTGCLYMDVDNTQEYSIIKLVLAIANHKNLEILINLMSKVLILTYRIKSYIFPLND